MAPKHHFFNGVNFHHITRILTPGATFAAKKFGSESVSPKPNSRQLLRLGIVTATPFIGFGFADNLIMILAGDAIDSTLGITLGISTLAAAGLGNLISDVVGIGAGDVIERYCYRIGLREPRLTAAQQVMNVTRHTKTVASALGISIGCLIGMFPLLFLHDRKKLYFSDQELLLFQNVFQPFGVTPEHFFALLHSAKWRTVEAGHVIVEAGSTMDRVVLVHSGHANAYLKTVDNKRTFVYSYSGKSPGSDELMVRKIQHDAKKVVPQQIKAPSEREDDYETRRGSIIGGTALVNMSVVKDPYPNTVIATTRCELLEWNINDLKEQIRTDKAIEAAMFSTLYLDLVESLKKTQDLTRAANVDQDKVQSLHEFGILIKAVLTDGRVHPSERQMVREFMVTHDISRHELRMILRDRGWSIDEWDAGIKTDYLDSTVQKKIDRIPNMLRSAQTRNPRAPPQFPPLER